MPAQNQRRSDLEINIFVEQWRHCEYINFFNGAGTYGKMIPIYESGEGGMKVQI